MILKKISKIWCRIRTVASDRVKNLDKFPSRIDKLVRIPSLCFRCDENSSSRWLNLICWLLAMLNGKFHTVWIRFIPSCNCQFKITRFIKGESPTKPDWRDGQWPSVLILLISRFAEFPISCKNRSKTRYVPESCYFPFHPKNWPRDCNSKNTTCKVVNMHVIRVSWESEILFFFLNNVFAG